MPDELPSFLDGVSIQALRGIDLTVQTGEFVAIMGPSGSGKSTLMHILGCLDLPDAGDYFLRGQDVTGMRADQLAVLRNQEIGFVFQNFNLLLRTSALENVETPLIYAGVSKTERRQRARTALQLALRALWRNKTRAMLTTLGVVIGVGSVIAMLGIGSGAQQRIATQLASMGTNSLVLRPGSVIRGGVHTGAGGITTLTRDDNIMLVSVTERTREIGIRMALGARQRDILWQFLLEALVLSTLGGLLGILLGLGGASAVARFSELPVSVTPASILIAFLFAGLVGVFFGLHPARKASRLRPIEALRYE